MSIALIHKLPSFWPTVHHRQRPPTLETAGSTSNRQVFVAQFFVVQDMLGVAFEDDFAHV